MESEKKRFIISCKTEFIVVRQACKLSIGNVKTKHIQIFKYLRNVLTECITMKSEHTLKWQIPKPKQITN